MFYLTHDELQNLPSVVVHESINPDNKLGPIPLQQELAYRKYTCAFIQEAGVKCKIPQLTIATALVFFHRFYAYHRFQDYDRYLVATTCIFLSTKVEETPMKLEYVIKASYYVHPQYKKEIDIESQEYKDIREKVLRLERLLLQTLGFDLKVEHPYRYLLQFLKKISVDKRLAQTAWNFVNDSLRTTLCLQFSPEKIAAASIYLAARYMEIVLPANWTALLDTDEEVTENISNQILDLYEGSEHATKMKQGSGGALPSASVTHTSPPNANRQQHHQHSQQQPKHASSNSSGNTSSNNDNDSSHNLDI